MEKELTGVGEYTLNLLKQLFSQDNKNEYYLFFNSRQKVDEIIPRFHQKNVHYCGFHWANKILNLSLKLLKYPKLDKWIQHKFKTPKIDLFFFPNISFFSINCPYLITAHDLSFEFFPEFLSLKRRLWHKTMNLKKLFTGAAHIISVSNNTKTDLINHYKINSKKITTIYSGLSENYKLIDKDDVRIKKVKQKYSLPDKFILFLGTIEPRKNIQGLIEAYNLLEQTEKDLPPLIIVGKLGWKFKKIIKSSSSNSKIHFIGFIRNQEKRYFYNLASLFVYPSFYEGFGFPPLEAILCGCPVITSNNSSILEICGDKAILIDPNNIQDIADAIKISLRDETPKPNLEQIKNDFNWTKSAEQTLSVLNKLAVLK
ncbi:MAG: Glycosyl transferase group 1 [Parcubacteria group bacterium GW2011_GWC2_39_14]|nr:MAG: Glycosyl transferase group 1 [Parcubacteria group bacterium GW2011_GWC2_39_14]KKR53500.1 MAG: Glycosyl transferase group 1 [Parcubacteria group bacterium GW2011_GWA2_40_23]